MITPPKKRPTREQMIDAAVRRVEGPSYWAYWIATTALLHGGALSDRCADCRLHTKMIRAEFRSLAVQAAAG